MARLALWTTCVHLVRSSAGGAGTEHEDHATDNLDWLDAELSSPGHDFITDIADRLNGEISGSGGAYTAGKGVLVRTPDFFKGKTKVVPATFWSNDIFAPSQLYPATIDPMCPTDGDGWSQLTRDCSAGSPWDRATVAVVISSSMSNLMTDFDNIQDADWGWGVFYPFDSNSADKRCHWRDEWNGWDCPGGFMEADGVTYHDDPTKGGAGAYLPGNPWVGGDGGGAGCHIDAGMLDQMDAQDVNLVQDVQCQCNYVFDDDWHHWLEHWMAKGIQKSGLEWRGWFANGKAPTWGVDASICWVNNIRDMISLQNELYWHNVEWSNQRAPLSNWGSGSADDRIYWGWNEIPVQTERVQDPNNWDSVIIKLPADICGNGNGGDDHVECLGPDQMRDLNEQLKSFENAGHLLKGIGNVKARPGSYILFVREYRVDSGWARWFFCRRAIIGDRQISTAHQACYYDDSKHPAPPPPPPCDCSWAQGDNACSTDDGSACWAFCCKHSEANSTEIVV